MKFSPFKPDAAEIELNKLGIYRVEERGIEQIRESGERWMGVAVHIALVLNEFKAPDHSFVVKNKRDLSMVITNWHFGTDEDTEQQVLSFTAWMRLPDAIVMTDIPPGLCQTFTDMCFYAGAEALPENFEVDVFTKPVTGATLTDLGWYLPCRMVDYLVDALGVMNDVALGSNMDQALIYTIDE